jgi:hypothetical protein
VSCADVKLLAAVCDCSDALGATTRLDQPGDVYTVGNDSSPLARFLECCENETHVICLAVIKEVPTGRLALGKGWEEFAHILTGDLAMPVGAPIARFGRPLVPIALLARTTQGRQSESVIHVERNTNQPVGTLITKRWDNHLEGLHKIRSHVDIDLTLQKSFTDEPKVKTLEVAEPTVN